MLLSTFVCVYHEHVLFIAPQLLAYRVELASTMISVTHNANSVCVE